MLKHIYFFFFLIFFTYSTYCIAEAVLSLRKTVLNGLENNKSGSLTIQDANTVDGTCYLAGFTNMFPLGAVKVALLKFWLFECGAGMLDLLIFTTFVSITWQSICIIVTTSVFLLSPCCHSVPKTMKYNTLKQLSLDAVTPHLCWKTNRILSLV